MAPDCPERIVERVPVRLPAGGETANGFELKSGPANGHKATAGVSGPDEWQLDHGPVADLELAGKIKNPVVSQPNR